MGYGLRILETILFVFFIKYFNNNCQIFRKSFKSHKLTTVWSEKSDGKKCKQMKRTNKQDNKTKNKNEKQANTHTYLWAKYKTSLKPTKFHKV